MDSPSEITAAHGRQQYINGVTIAFLILSWTAVSLRMYVRALMIKNFGWDDAVMLLAAVGFHRTDSQMYNVLMDKQISNTIYSAFNFLLISYGFGNPRLLLEPPSIIAKVTTVRSPPLHAFPKHCLLSVVPTRYLWLVRRNHDHRQDLVGYLLPPYCTFDMAALDYLHHCGHLDNLRNILLLRRAFPVRQSDELSRERLRWKVRRY